MNNPQLEMTSIQLYFTQCSQRAEAKSRLRNITLTLYLIIKHFQQFRSDELVSMSPNSENADRKSVV